MFRSCPCKSANMKYLILTACLLTIIRNVLSTDCICSYHRTRPVWPCQSKGMLWTAELYGDPAVPKCFPKALNVITNPGWVAGIYDNQLVYMQQDFAVRVQSCNEPRSKAVIIPDPSCPPTMMPGTYLNPTTTPKPTTTSTTTTSTTTTTTTTTTTPTPTTTSTTTTTTTTTPPTTFVPIPVVPHSKKCDFFKLAMHQVQKTLAVHPRAKLCNDGTHAAAEALLFETCHNINYNYFQWKQELKIVDNCRVMPKGEPIVYYVNNRPALIAVFWECNPTGGFKIAYQTCGTPLQIVDIANVPYFMPQSFYSVSW